MTDPRQNRLTETNETFEKPTITIRNPKTGIVLTIDTSQEPFHDCRDSMSLPEALNLDLGASG